MFSFRYDAHLVPALLANIRPMVDGWVSWDDRDSPAAVSNDRELRLRLLQAAYDAGADWVLRIDPDERFETRLADRMDALTRRKKPIVWTFPLRELYAPDAYRVDGLWRKKRQGRLFPLFDWMFPVTSAAWVDPRGFHSVSFPPEFREKKSRINLYHLKMIDEKRRRHRRDLYAALDPDGRYQAEGYDYLADEAGAVFKKIPRRRGYFPPHAEDGGLWMPAEFGAGIARGEGDSG
jgi:hypothetical protein